MYPSKGSNSYGQQSYLGQQSYAQVPGTGFSQGQSTTIGANQDADVNVFRSYPSQAAQYSGPYAALYGTAALSAAQQAGVGGKGTVPSGVQERMSYPSTLPPESSKFSSGALGSNLGMNNDDYVSASNRGYAQKGDQFSAVKSSEHASTERRQYGDQAAYLGRELQSDSSRRYADSVPLNQLHQASLLRQQQMLNAQALQPGSDMRQADYLAARAAQEFSSYGGRADVNPRSLPILGSAPYGGQDAASILGGAPRRNVDDLYAQGSSSATYGVGLPPGRDYVAGKALQGPSLESEYQGNALLRGHPNLGASMADESKDDRVSYRQLELRNEERRRELLREREKEREREEQREHQRERDRERDRLERREKERERDRERERERDRKREVDSRRQRTPPRANRDCRGSSLLKDERTPRRASPRRLSPRRVSPRRDAVHRRRSPVKEKKREYRCKVYPFCLVDAERDYLSLNKRYPRLSISPDFSKVVLHWPKEKLHLSLHTPVRFEHEVVEVDSKGEKGSYPLDDLSGSTRGSTVWNAKVILMSGISAGALSNLSSYKSSDEKILHFNNILRFAILRKDRSFTAIGGPWDPTIDGGDPSMMDSSLIQTACRYVRDTTQLDLQKCQNWNRFLEIHYDRVGNDGLFSHKEITVLFVPDLSECLPSLDSWRSQWLAHKKDVADRESLLAAKQEKKSTKKEDSVKEKVKANEDIKVSKSGTDVPVLGKETDKGRGEGSNTTKKSKKNRVEQKGQEIVLDTKQTEAAVKGEVEEEGKIDSKKAKGGAAVIPSVNVQKSGKKKEVKKVVNGKIASKKAVAQKVESSLDTPTTKEKATGGAAVIPSVNVQKSGKKKEVKKVVNGKIASKKAVAQKVESSLDTPTTKEKPVAEMVNKDEEKIAKIEPVDTASSQGKVVKTTGKKKIIRRVIKRKVSGTEVKALTAIKKETTEIIDNAAVEVHKAKEGEEIKEEIGTKNAGVVGITKDNTTDEPKKVVAEKESKDEKNPKAEKEGSKDGVSDDQNLKSEKRGSKSSAEAKPESKPKSLKEVKEKVKPEEPPEQPGLFLQTKRSGESRIRTMSLSLDGLLDYNDKDIEESTFELSVFAESLNEMLQYQMGCRLLSFLKKLRRKFILSKNQRKRLRDDKTEKESEKESSAKRPKVIDGSAVGNESKESGTKDASKKNSDETMGEDGSATGEDGSKTENKSVDGTYDVDNDDEEDIEEEEDPEEIIEDDQEMEDVSALNNGVQEHDGNVVAKSATEYEKPTVEENNGEKSIDDTSNKNHEKEDDKQSETVRTDSGKEVVVHEEVLQAFRYFDHNRVGYIKVEDLRCLIHNLGKFHSHREVKEMIQSALFESNSARDNRIFYKKLVRLTDI